jgi:hypothetical protein
MYSDRVSNVAAARPHDLQKIRMTSDSTVNGHMLRHIQLQSLNVPVQHRHVRIHGRKAPNHPPLAVYWMDLRFDIPIAADAACTTARASWATAKFAVSVNTATSSISFLAINPSFLESKIPGQTENFKVSSNRP